MYGCSSPCVVYGWQEPVENIVIHDEWLTKYEIQLFANEVVKNHACSAIYGIVIPLKELSGESYSDDEDDYDEDEEPFNLEEWRARMEQEKQKVRLAYETIVGYCKTFNRPEPKFGHFLAVYGDMSWNCLEEYNPEEE